MNKFDKNLQSIEDAKNEPLDNVICANCIHYDNHSESKDFGFCKRYNENVDSNYFCTSFIQYAADFIKQNMNDPIKPDHYKQGKLTCVEVCESMCANKVGIEAAHVFNITKYIYRYNMKDGIKDVRKAREYCDFLITHLEQKEND